MQFLVLQENIARLERYLQFETVERSRQTLHQMIRAAKRELAVLEAVACGTQPGAPALGQAPDGLQQIPACLTRFRDEFEASSQPYLLLDPRPGLRIVHANQSYRDATMTDSGISGRGLFDVFPDNPEDLGADGVSNLFASLRDAALRGQPQTMAVQRYDVRNQHGIFVERYWRPVNTPVFNETGRLVFLLHHVVDVTAEILTARRPVRRALSLEPNMSEGPRR